MKISTNKPQPDISVITCHHKGTFINGFIESIKKSVGVSFEIIVVTSDEELALTGINGCAVQYSTNMPAGKRNEGVRISRGKYLAFFDDDTEIEADCLKQYYDFLEAYENVGMVYGKLHNAEFRDRFDEAGGFLTNTGFIWSRAGQNDIDTGQYDHHGPILSGKSASCMIRRSVFTNIDGFDEDFEILGEETDLAWRVWLSGFSVYFLPHAKGIHYFNTKWKPANEYYTSKRVQFNGCRNYITMLIKNLGSEHLWIVPIHMSIWLTVGLAMIGTLKVRQGCLVLSGLCYVLRNFPAILAKRRKVQERRVVLDHHIWSKIHRNPPKGYYMQRVSRYLRIGLHG